MKIFKNIYNQKGAAAVEFAIVLPLLLLLLFGIIEFSLLLYNKAMLTNASREGARLGVVYAIGKGLDGSFGTADDTTHSTKAEIEQTVIAYAKNHLITFGSDILDTSDIILTAATSTGSAGDILTVTVNYKYDFLVFPDISQLVGGSYSDFTNLTATTKMRLE